MLQPNKTIVNVDRQSVEVYVEPLLPPGRKREELKKQLEAQENEEKKKIKDTEYMKYLKDRRKKEIDRFSFGVCLYKCFCCFRDKPPEGYFYYGPPKKLAPGSTPEYRKPYKETKEMKIQRKLKEEVDRARAQRILEAQREDMDEMAQEAMKHAREAGYGYGPGYGPDYGPGYGPGYTAYPGPAHGLRPVQGRGLHFRTGPCKCHDNVRRYRLSKGAPADLPDKGGPKQPGGISWPPPGPYGPYGPPGPYGPMGPYGPPGMYSSPEQLKAAEEGGEEGALGIVSCNTAMCVCGKRSNTPIGSMAAMSYESEGE